MSFDAEITVNYIKNNYNIEVIKKRLVNSLPKGYISPPAPTFKCGKYTIIYPNEFYLLTLLEITKDLTLLTKRGFLLAIKVKENPSMPSEDFIKHLL